MQRVFVSYRRDPTKAAAVENLRNKRLRGKFRGLCEDSQHFPTCR